MFRSTSRQTSLLEASYLLPDKKRERLVRSWAHAFRTRVMPHVDEELFRDAFCADNGRPNFSIRLLAGAHLLKETNDLTDGQVIEQVEFNVQWQYALGVTPEEAHLVQRTMHSFRVLLTKNDRAARMFEDLTRKLAVAEGISLGRQRLDSTHVLSNIAVLTRLTLFCETVVHFLRVLRKELPARLEALDGRFRRRYLEREGYFADAKREQARRRLPVVAADLYELVRAFEGDAEVQALEAFALLRRLFEEQCEVVRDDDEDDVDRDAGAAASDVERGAGLPKVKVREPKTVSSSSLQSPHDPDATYGHKGKGYEVQLSETCDEDNPFQIVTGVAVNGACESDQAALVPFVDQLIASDLAPEALLADTGYGSGANIVACAERGIDLQAPVQDPNAPAAVDRFLASGAPRSDAPVAAAIIEPTHETACEPTPNADVSGRSQLPDGLDLASFAFTSTFQHVLACPAGHEPVSQHLAGALLVATFSAAQCPECPLASLCPTRALKDGSRQLRLAPATIATQVRQHEQRTPLFKERYRMRSGIESTNGTLKGRHGLDDLRVRGKPRVTVAAILKTLALNTRRVVQHHVSLLRPDGEPCPA